MPMHYLAWQQTAQSMGGEFPEPLFYELAGVPTVRIVEILNEKFGYGFNPQEFTEIKENLYMEKYLPTVNPIEPVVAVARKYQGRLPMAVATGAVQRVVQAALAATNLTDMFDTVVGADDVKHGKPAPDTFLEAARRLGVEPQYCLVYEDSDLGLEAAQRAGMTGIDVRPYIAQWKNGH
ncbi:MAG: HAD-IA family hydrolase [Anaerolineae bacterium]|nr:HAD-IA family hydrolase [Anaerolineae bacterium]MCB0226500.1 HAD-IA family hydrolase [Anaerolineae bacterium]